MCYDATMSRSSDYAQHRPTIVVLGALNMDLVALSPRFPEPGETMLGTSFNTYPGGKGANQAVAAARLVVSGGEVKMIGRVGGDYFGRQLLDSLRSNGVDASGVGVEAESASGVGLINIDDSAQNRIVMVPGANGSCGEAEVERTKEALANASVLLIQLEVPMWVSMAVAREAASANVVVILDPGPATSLPQEFYGYCSIITPNETEAQGLVGYPVADPPSAQKAAEDLMGRGAGCAIIKMGAQGAYVATSSKTPESVHWVKTSRYFPAFPVEAVDTVAAGDAFNGALAVANAEGKGMEEAVRWAMAAGALAVTRTGAQPSMPHRADVEKLLSSQQSG